MAVHSDKIHGIEVTFEYIRVFVSFRTCHFSSHNIKCNKTIMIVIIIIIIIIIIKVITTLTIYHNIILGYHSGTDVMLRNIKNQLWCIFLVTAVTVCLRFE